MPLIPPKKPTSQPIPSMKPTTEGIAYLVESGFEDEARELCKKWNMAFPGGEKSTIPSVDAEQWLLKLQTNDPRMLELKRQVRLLAPASDPVLICGPSGTGKEIVAHALHGDRPDAKFIAINCAGMPEYLIESELFGHVRGAYTGAESTTAGLMKAANDGTLFLDEIGDLHINVQAKLLRALQTRTVRKVGSIVDEPITCRFVAATHHNLLNRIKEKAFRLDLYARLSTFELKTTPLADRVADIPLILDVLDPEKLVPRDVFFHEYEAIHTLNVRALERVVRRTKVYKKFDLSYLEVN